MTLTDFPYLDLLRQVMARYLPQWDWLYGPAQLWQESRWQPDAVSPVGAQGLAQFMPGTWADMRRDLRFPEGALATNPVYAIPAYGYYMRKMRNVWDSPHVQRSEDERRQLAMACYNCGTGNILKAQRLAHDSPRYADIIAALPGVAGVDWRQTTDYVRLIEQHYAALKAQEDVT